MNDLMTAAEVAELLKVKPNYIYQLKAQGKIPYLNIGSGRCLRFSRSSIEEWLKTLETK